MERLGGEDRGQTASIRQVALASLLGTTIEWYDFFIYVTAASFVFNRFRTYAVGYGIVTFDGLTEEKGGDFLH